MNSHSNVLVMDNGMWSIKTGFAGDEAPRHLQRTLVGTCNNKTISRKIHKKEFYSGQDILDKKSILDIRSPVSLEDYFHVESFVHQHLGIEEASLENTYNPKKEVNPRISFRNSKLGKTESLENQGHIAELSSKEILQGRIFYRLSFGRNLL